MSLYQLTHFILCLHTNKDERDQLSDSMNLKPLDAVFWDYKGTIEFGEFDNDYTVLLYADPKLSSEKADAIYGTDALNNITIEYKCSDVIGKLFDLIK